MHHVHILDRDCDMRLFLWRFVRFVCVLRSLLERSSAISDACFVVCHFTNEITDPT